LDVTLCEAGETVAELAVREARIHPDSAPKVNVEGIAELVADKGYHSGAALERVKKHQVRSYIPERQQKGRRKREGKAGQQQAVYANRRRVQGTTVRTYSDGAANWWNAVSPIATTQAECGARICANTRTFSSGSWSM